MKGLVLVLLYPLAALAQNPHEQDVHRALIQLDQRTADFARGAPPAPLSPEVGRPLSADPEIARQLRPYERMKAAEARGEVILQLPPPLVRRELDKPLPLPGGPRAGVDPVTNPGVPN
jgi:hypothetical protein